VHISPIYKPAFSNQVYLLIHTTSQPATGETKMARLERLVAMANEINKGYHPTVERFCRKNK
jgi:hypothetical protein